MNKTHETFAEKVVRHREAIKTRLTSTSLPLRQSKILCECKLGSPLFACAARALVHWKSLGADP